MSDTLCQLCKAKPGKVRCQACGILLCDDCIKFDLFGHGCGCIVPVFMCLTCINNPAENPYTRGTFE